MMNIINTTPHNINILIQDGSTRTIPSSGTTLRVSTRSGKFEAVIDGITINGQDIIGDIVAITEGVEVPFGEVPEREGTVYIVSGMVGGALRHRSDVLVPMTSPSDSPIRNEKGHIVAVRGLKRP